MDFAVISAQIEPVVKLMDHRHLGTYDDFDTFQVDQWGVTGMGHTYPSSENLLFWIAVWIDERIPWSKLALEETCTSYAELTREEFNATRDQS